MTCKGLFAFKSLEVRKAGNFKRGSETVEYGESYILKVDELSKEGVFERKFKIDVKNQGLASALRELELYDKINITFEVNFFLSGVRLTPIEFELAQ